MFCESKVKLLSELKILSTENDTKEVAEDLVAFYVFPNRIQKVIFLKCFIRKSIQNGRIESLAVKGVVL